jgi:hypothetical protein
MQACGGFLFQLLAGEFHPRSTGDRLLMWQDAIIDCSAIIKLE